MSTALTLLGVKGGPAIRPGSRMPTAFLLEMAGQRILVDAGLGATRGICDQGVRLREIDRVLITHLHSDHYLELGPFFHTAWVDGLTRPIPVTGPTGLAAYWRGFLASMEFDISLRIEDEGRCELAGLACLAPLSEGKVFEGDGLTIRAMRNRHPPIEESFALRFETPEHCVVLSGDTAYMAEMAAFAAGADILVHEAMLTAGVDALVAQLPNRGGRLKAHILASHTSAEDAGRVAAGAGVGRLVLNHFIPDGMAGFGATEWIAAARTHWQGPLDLGHDGMRLEL